MYIQITTLVCSLLSSFFITVAAEEVTRQDKFKRLYEAQSSVPSSQTSPTQQQQSQPSHHSAFSKSKQAKFRNPFRRNVDVETPSDTIVISRYDWTF